MTAFDYSTNKMIMYFLQPVVTDPKSAIDYRITEFEVNADTIHELDQIEFHRSASEMLYSKVVRKTMSATMLQKIVSNLQTQMKLDKASLHAKDLRIKSLEDLVIETGVDPSNTEVGKIDKEKE